MVGITGVGHGQGQPATQPPRPVLAKKELVVRAGAQIYALRAGPYYEFLFSQHWSGRLGGGLALAVADTSYSYHETIAFGSGLVVNNAGSSSGVEFQAGGYLEGKLLYAVTPCTSLFAGAQYECLGTFSRNAGNEQAQLDMSSAVYV